MLKNYITIAWKNFLKNKAFSFIHILGLTIGITVCLMIFLFILNEFNVDNFHIKGKNIYRVMRGFNNDKPPAPYLSGPYGPALQNDFPNYIKRVVRVAPSNNLLSSGDKAFNEKKVLQTDANFFNFFSFALLQGNPETALKDPHSIVLTESTAKKYFGTVENAIGKVLQFDKTLSLKVTAIAKDVPSNSHLDFDAVYPLSNRQGNESFKNWISNFLFTYVELNDHVTKGQVEKQLPGFMKKYMGEIMEQYHYSYNLSLTPLTDIYFEPSGSSDTSRHGDKKMVYIFVSIAVLIMLIACINFMNLSTIRAVERSKEVGLRKVLGAVRKNLIFQFIGESVLHALLSCVLSIALLFALLPYYNQLLGYQLTIPWNNVSIYLFLLGVILVVGFLAGSYPALFLSAFSPIQALKGKLRLGKGGVLFRQTLVVVQFSISVLLIICTVVIMNQMRYVKSKQLGYDKSQIVVVSIDNNDIWDHMSQFKTELERNSNIQAVSLMSGQPGGFFDGQSFEAEGQTEPFTSRTEFADFEYVKTLGLKIIAGRDFSPQFGTDTLQAALINRTAAQRLGFTPEQAVGKWIKNNLRDDERRRIIGVIEDYNFLSLKQNMDALVISPAMDRRVALIKVKPGKITAGLAAINETYKRVAPVYPFEYTFLDQQFEKTYKTDIRQQTILSIFSGLAIFIACLGLFGLASFTAAKRTKEIGVRKVLGSSISNILMLLSRDLLKPVLVATVIAMPLGYYFTHKWLQNFAYRIDINWWMFAFAAAVTALIAFATISFQSIKAAIANPVNSLRNE